MTNHGRRVAAVVSVAVGESAAAEARAEEDGHTAMIYATNVGIIEEHNGVPGRTMAEVFEEYASELPGEFGGSAERTLTAARAGGKTGRPVVERAVKEGHEVTAFVHSDGPFYVKILLATFLRGATPDKAKMESTVSGSDLDWVITRPAVLTNRPATGDVRIFSADNRDKAHSITRSDLAAFLVAQLTSDDHLRQAVTIATGDRRFAAPSSDTAR